MTIKAILKTAAKAVAAVAGVGAIWLAIKPEDESPDQDLLSDLPDLPDEEEKDEAETPSDEPEGEET